MYIWIWITYAFIFGLCFGSFANVLAYRLPRKLSVIKPASSCPACKHRLGVLDLIPVLSHAFLRGRCRYCKKSISVRYSIVELICAMLFAGMVFFTTSLSAIPLAFLAFILLAITLIDWSIQEIPNNLVIAGSIAGVAWIAAAFFIPEILPHAPVWHNALIGAAVGAMPLLLIDRVCIWALKKDGFGYGDVKLMAMAGLFLGWHLTLVAFLFAFITAGAYAAFLMATGRAKTGTYIAFGPFLCAGSLAALWFGQEFMGLLFT